MSWRISRLGDVITLKRGHDLPDSRRQDGDVPVVSSSGTTGRHNEARARAPGVVTGRYGTLGEVFYIEEDYWPLNTALYVIDFKGNHPRFVAYLLKNVLKNYKSDKAAVPGVDRNVLHELKVRITDVQSQVQIAGILSAYDELIANNRRRMVLLENAAAELYREWFVRFRFPGYEHTCINNGVPDGYKREVLSEMCELIDYGYTASAQSEIVGPKFLRITDIVDEAIDWTAVPHCTIDDARVDRFRLREGDIVIARTGATVGHAKRLHKRHPTAVFASYLVRLRLIPTVSNVLIGSFVESDSYKAYVRSRVGGAAQPNANARVLAGVEIIVPPRKLQREFEIFAEPVFDQREVLQLENERLRAARDLLLPRLMSGEIVV